MDDLRKQVQLSQIGWSRIHTSLPDDLLLQLPQVAALSLALLHGHPFGLRDPNDKCTTYFQTTYTRRYHGLSKNYNIAEE